jgi:Ran GTPase-activating protein (RanGAP) involved in mRNA processing and transport
MNSLTDDDLHPLFRRLPETGLTSLALDFNRISDPGVAQLAARIATQDPPLFQALSLVGNDVGDVGAHALASLLPKLPSFRILRLADNPLSEDGVRTLSFASSQGWAVSRNLVVDIAIQRPAERDDLPRLSPMCDL